MTAAMHLPATTLAALKSAGWVQGDVSSVPDLAALIVVTSTAGAREAESFWRDAQQTGLAYASPRQFPWTLTNSPAGEIARELQERGPVYTIVPGYDWVDFASEIAAHEVGRAPGLPAGMVIHERKLDGELTESAWLLWV